jgi:EamA domain-containing membrane protein RarD
MTHTPLWLPTGSVRAIIALGFAAAGILALFMTPDVPEWFALLLGIVIRDYFQTRQDADADGEPDEEEPVAVN